jgi:hypothetical protein
MKNAVEMGSGAVIYVQDFIKFGSEIQKLLWVCYTKGKAIPVTGHEGP